MATQVHASKFFTEFGPFGQPARLPLLTGSARKETFKSVPVIDLSALRSKDENARATLAQEIFVACRDVGFFYASAHGVDYKIIQNAFQEVRDFFKLPEEEKKAVHFHKSSFFRGYEDLFATRHESRGQGDMKEAFSYTSDNEPSPNQWPAGHPTFRAALTTYYTELYDLGQRLHNIFALALSLPEDYFTQKYKSCRASVRALHYPPQKPQDSDEVGFGAHTDSTLFTLIYQDGLGGLEVQNANGEWIPVIPKEGTFVVNIGDLMQFISGGNMQSTRHRVVNCNGAERYSVAFFWMPNDADRLEVAETCHIPGQEYSDLDVKEYMQKRFKGSRLSHPLLKEGY